MGDGRTINIWNDAWIGGNGTGKVITPIRLLDRNATVDTLLDNENHEWRMDIVSEVFFSC